MLVGGIGGGYAVENELGVVLMLDACFRAPDALWLQIEGLRGLGQVQGAVSRQEDRLGTAAGMKKRHGLTDSPIDLRPAGDSQEYRVRRDQAEIKLREKRALDHARRQMWSIRSVAYRSAMV